MVRASVVVLGVLSALRADARPVRLDVEVDACPDLAAKLRAVAPFDVAATASVSVTERARVATILLDDGHGHAIGPRIVEAADCRELATSVTMIVAMSLPAIADAIDPAPVEPMSVQPVAVAEQPSIEVVVEPVAVTHASVGASVGVSSAAGTVAAIGARWGGSRFSIGGEVAAGWRPQIEVMPGAGVDVTRFAAAALPCAHLGAFGLCGVVRAGFDRGRGSGLMDARTVNLPVLELGGRVIWERPVTERLALQLHGELAGALTSSELTVDHAPVWHSNRYEALAGATVLVRFP